MATPPDQRAREGEGRVEAAAGYRAGTSRHYPAHRVVEVIDSTGASDAFAAAFALKLTGGGSESDAIHSALSAAAFAIKRPGGYESMPFAVDLHAAARR